MVTQKSRSIIRSCSIEQLSPKLRSRLKKLTLSKYSGLKNWLNFIDQFPKRCHRIFYYVGEEQKCSPVDRVDGWCFVLRLKHCRYLHGGVYISRAVRRRGIASKLLKSANRFGKKINKTIYFTPPNVRSREALEKISAGLSRVKITKK